MAGFFTRPDLDDRQFKQISGSTLTMSGETNFVGTLKSKGIEIDASTGSSSIGDVLTWDGSKITLSPSSGGGSDIYTGASPTVLSSPVGGMQNNVVLTGRTISSILEEILIETLNPSVINPSHTLTENTANTQEVGTTVNFNLCSTFSQGSITPQYDSGGNCIAPSIARSGPANTYCYTGAGGLSCSVASALGSNSIPVSHLLTSGSNTFSSCVFYDTNGIVAYDSSGAVFAGALPAGNTSVKNVTLTGQYYRFYGASATSPANSAEVRALPVGEFQTSSINTFCLNTGAVQTKFVVALPPGRTINEVIDLETNANITDQYDGTGIGAVAPISISVNTGGGSGGAVNYCQYEMNSAIPYSSNHRHRITTA